MGKHTKHPLLYSVWANMIYRCETKTAKQYKNYGARGISVCPEWRHSYDNFERWAFAKGYTPGLTLDRINNNGHYEPGNCRWTDNLTSMNNTRWNRKLTAFGESKNYSEWAKDERCKVPYHVLYSRINRYGWATEEAITTPLVAPFGLRPKR